MILLKEECMCACPWASTLTALFFVTVFFAIRWFYYLVAFFLPATVLRLPLRVRALFLVL